MTTDVIHLDDEELTQYFENPVQFELYLERYFDNITSLELGEWVIEDENKIELKITHESMFDKLLKEHCHE